jgi:hypothetical protein
MTSLIRVLGVALASAVVLASIAARLNGLYEGRQRAEAEPGVTEDVALFTELLESGLLTPREDGGLDRVPRDWLLRQAIAGDPEPPLGPDGEIDEDALEAQQHQLADRRRLLGVLDYSAVGAIVSQQVDLWNQTRNLAAVRDNRPRDEVDGPLSWSATDPNGRPLVSGRLVPETFGFIHDGILRAGFSDWLSIPGRHDEITFRTTIEPDEAGSLTIQLIGTPIRLPAGARSYKLVGEQPEGCLGEPVAHVISLPARAGELELTVAPSINCASRIHGLAIRFEEPDEDEPYAEPRYSFRPVRRSRPVGKYAIRTLDGTWLTDPSGSGRPSEISESIGLVPLVGTGGGDSFALTGMLASSRLPLEGLEVALTIDSRIQTLAHEAVAWGITRFGNDRWAGERKAALLILDADSGAILAVAGQPTIPPGLADWDLPSFSASFPLRDPSSVLAWEVIDKHNTPGSTYKPVTALALMMEEDPEFRSVIRDVILGTDSGTMSRVIGVGYGSSAFVAYGGAKPVPNFGGATMGRYLSRAKRDGRCLKDDPEAAERARKREPGFGMRQATQFSLNAWYAAVALKMEKKRINAYAAKVEGHAGERLPAPEMTITRTARWIGIDDRERLDLASNVPETMGLKRYTGEAHDIMYPQLARSTLAGMAYNKDDWGARPLLMYTAALNGIGQTISASPLQMALAASTIATGSRPHAHLISEWNGVPLAPKPADPIPVDPELLGVLRDGMKGVPEAGTAARAFPRPLACRTYGKTGTAEIDAARSYNSAWFIGWREPKQDSAQRRLAFACMTTHATGGYRFGGTACAPIVSRVMVALEEAPEGET